MSAQHNYNECIYINFLGTGVVKQMKGLKTSSSVKTEGGFAKQIKWFGILAWKYLGYHYW